MVNYQFGWLKNPKGIILLIIFFIFHNAFIVKVCIKSKR